jgi:beta-lactamase superfamily II metal-dependent hydrolase
VLLGLIHPNLGRLAGWLAWPFAAYTLRLVEAFGSIPNPAWEFGRISPWIAAAAYALLFGLTFLRGRLAGWTRILRPSLGVGALGALTLLAWQAALAGPDGRLHLTLLDTGAAQSMLIQTPGGGQILINGGESATALQTVLDRRRPVLTSCELDLLVVAPKRSADLLGLPDLAGRCPPAWALWAGPMQNTRTAQRLVERLMEQDVPIIPAEAGQSVTLGGSGELRVLSAGKEGILLLLEYGNFRAWLPFGDPPGEEVPGPVTAMLGGSRIEDLGSLYPDLILVSGTVDDPQVLETFQGYNLFTTARNGWIEIETDGDSLWVEVENK